jgi:hypothetical protein
MDGPQGLGFLSGEPAVVIAPLGGRLVVFESHLEHEVLPAHRERYSVTAWLYRGDASAGGGAGRSVGEDPGGSGYSEDGGADAAGCGGAAQDGVAWQSAQRPSTAAPPPPAAVRQEGLGAEEVWRGRIFVSIPAYRDAECAWTLKDLFLKADHPDRVFAGVAWQVSGVQARCHGCRVRDSRGRRRAAGAWQSTACDKPGGGAWGAEHDAQLVAGAVRGGARTARGRLWAVRGDVNSSSRPCAHV